MLKRLMACLVTVLMVCTTACSEAPASSQEGQDQGAQSENSPNADPIKLQFFSLNGDYNTAKGEEAKEAVEAAILEDLGINCDITMITSDSFSNDQIAVKIAAGELDALSSNMPITSWQTFIDKGMLLELDDMLASDGQDLVEQVDEKLWDPHKVNGKTYLIPIQSPVPFYCSTWLRMDLFRKNGIEEVPDTVQELIDGLYTVCQNDPSLIGMSAGHISWIYNSGPLNYHLVNDEGNQTSTEGNAMARYIDNEVMLVYLDDEGFRQSLQRSVDLYADGILDPEIFTTTFDHADQLVAEDRVVCIGNSYSFQTTADRKAGLDPDFPVEEGKEQEWVFLTNLENDINGGATTWQYGYETGMFVGIVTTTKYPTEIMKILNWVCASEENYALANWGIEGEHWDYNEEGLIEFAKDDSGNNVVEGGLGGMISNLYADWWVPLTTDYYGTEWEKIFEEPPTTCTWTNCDGFINYQYSTDATVRSDMETLSAETVVNIITGKTDLEDGMSQMIDNLNSIGYEEYYAERNEQYCAGMGLS